MDSNQLTDHAYDGIQEFDNPFAWLVEMDVCRVHRI